MLFIIPLFYLFFYSFNCSFPCTFTIVFFCLCISFSLMSSILFAKNESATSWLIFKHQIKWIFPVALLILVFSPHLIYVIFSSQLFSVSDDEANDARIVLLYRSTCLLALGVAVVLYNTLMPNSVQTSVNFLLVKEFPLSHTSQAHQIHTYIKSFLQKD